MIAPSEILDETEFRPGVSALAAECMGFTMCPDCGHVDPHMVTKTNHPCQKCGKPVDHRRILFSTQSPLLEMIFESYQSTNSKQMCVLLFCALIEQHVLNLLKSRCIRLNIDRPVTELLLEGYEKVQERLKLFERLTGIQLRKALHGRPFASVFETYESLKKKRNGIAHGNPGATYAITNDDIKKAVNAAADSFPLFAHLHHNFCAEDSPPLPNSREKKST
jgi:hypothetical protein